MMLTEKQTERMYLDFIYMPGQYIYEINIDEDIQIVSVEVNSAFNNTPVRWYLHNNGHWSRFKEDIV